MRGTLRGTTTPIALPAVVKGLGLEAGSPAAHMVPGLVEELLGEHALHGTLRSGAGGTWLPAIHAQRQQAAIAAFYAQNGYLECAVALCGHVHDSYFLTYLVATVFPYP